MSIGMDVVHIHERPALYYSLVLFLIGGQMMSMGFLGELITAHLGHDLDTYSITEQTPDNGRGVPTESAPTPLSPFPDEQRLLDTR